MRGLYNILSVPVPKAEVILSYKPDNFSGFEVKLHDGTKSEMVSFAYIVGNASLSGEKLKALLPEIADSLVSNIKAVLEASGNDKGPISLESKIFCARKLEKPGQNYEIGTQGQGAWGGARLLTVSFYDPCSGRKTAEKVLHNFMADLDARLQDRLAEIGLSRSGQRHTALSPAPKAL